jgi:hypothetical protein
MMGLQGMRFPASKDQLLEYAEGRDAPEASIVALNELPSNVLYVDLDSVCENVGIVCSLELYRKLEGMRFPASKDEIIAYAARRGVTHLSMNALEELNPDAEYHSVHEICSGSGLEE